MTPYFMAAGEITKTRKRLRELCDKPGMAQRSVAVFTGVDKTAVCRFLQGKDISAINYIALKLWMDEQ